jgi:hypothetical protein
MSLIDANHAIEAFLDAIGEAEAMAAGGGQVGVEFDYLLRHAAELIDLVDEEISKADIAGRRYLTVSAAVLRERLEQLRNQQRAGTGHCVSQSDLSAGSRTSCTLPLLREAGEKYSE